MPGRAPGAEKAERDPKAGTLLSMGNTVRTSLSDLLFAAGQLRWNPGFTTVTMITLALGIGASMAISSATNPALFKPLPYPHPGRIPAIWSTWQGACPERRS
jgi:hypothetical protein